MHPINADFYGHEMKAIVLGYIRPELDYTSRGMYRRRFSNDDQFFTRPPFFSIFLEDLIEDIETDKRVALKSLMRPDYQKFVHDGYFEFTPIHNLSTQTNRSVPVYPESL